MNPLITVVLFWTVVAAVSVLFGIACIKYGVYTAGNQITPATLEV